MKRNALRRFLSNARQPLELSNQPRERFGEIGHLDKPKLEQTGGQTHPAKHPAHFALRYSGEPLQEDFTKDVATLAEDIFQSWDNWNVDEMRIEGEDPTTHRTDCILYATGSPFVRMTAQNKGIELIPANQPCP